MMIRKIMLGALLMVGMPIISSDAEKTSVWVSSSDNHLVKVQTGLFGVIDSVVEDIEKAGESQEDAIPLFNTSKMELHHAICVMNFYNHASNYVLPVTREELRKQAITLEGLIRALNYLQSDKKSFLNKVYVAWLNNPNNENAAVHHRCEVQELFNQIGVDTDNISGDVELWQPVVLQKEDIKHIKNYKNRKKVNLSIQNLLDSGEQFFITEDRTLKLSSKNITFLEGLKNIPGVDQLVHLDLSKNKIKCLDKEIFSDLNQLARLNLSENKIKHLDKEIFSGLNQLDCLNLSENKIKHLDKEIFSGLNQLTHLNLSENKIKHLDKEIFSNFNQLDCLNLSENKIKHLDKEIFSNLNQLQHLYLSKNEIEHLDKEIFSNLNQLGHLDLSKNKIKHLDKEVFNNLNQLQNLYLLKNEIEHFDKEVFSNLNQLRNLELSENKIEYLYPEVFSGLNQLWYLHLSKNKIKHFDSKILSVIDQVRHLDLSENKLSVYDMVCYDSCTKNKAKNMGSLVVAGGLLYGIVNYLRK